MQFREPTAIYLQIADYICERILLKDWAPEERLPAARELGAQLEVNPKTVMRTFEFLQGQNIIYTQRGTGYYVRPDAVANAALYQRSEFIEKDLPGIFRNIYMLDMDIDDLKHRYETFKSTISVK